MITSNISFHSFHHQQPSFLFPCCSSLILVSLSSPSVIPTPNHNPHCNIPRESRSINFSANQLLESVTCTPAAHTCYCIIIHWKLYQNLVLPRHHSFTLHPLQTFSLHASPARHFHSAASTASQLSAATHSKNLSVASIFPQPNHCCTHSTLLPKFL